MWGSTQEGVMCEPGEARANAGMLAGSSRDRGLGHSRVELTNLGTQHPIPWPGFPQAFPRLPAAPAQLVVGTQPG